MDLVSAIKMMEKEELDALAARPSFSTVLNTGIAHLYQNDLSPGPQNEITDFVEATFTGYSAVNPAAWQRYVDATDSRESLTTLSQFSFVVGAGPVTANTIHGWYYTNAAGDLLFSQRFDNPIDMDVTGKVIFILPVVKASGIDGPDALED